MSNYFINALDLTEAKRVLLVPREEYPDDALIEMQKVLGERFPNVEFTIVSGMYKPVVLPDNLSSYDIEVDDE